MPHKQLLMQQRQPFNWWAASLMLLRTYLDYYLEIQAAGALSNDIPPVSLQGQWQQTTIFSKLFLQQQGGYQYTQKPKREVGEDSSVKRATNPVEQIITMTHIA